MSKFFQQSLDIHRYLRGKWAIKSKVPLQNRDDLSVAYTPGVAAVSNKIAEEPNSSYSLTMKGNSVAIVSDGSAVLGLGDIGPQAALPVMEGKAILFKEFADIDGVPLVINAGSVEEIVTTVKTVAPTFGGINLEDIAAPKCFEIEERLQDIGIPVFHDDQHGTAIVLLAALINACKVTGKSMQSLKVVINGAGAAGTAIARLLRCVGHDENACNPVEDVLVCDSKGIISKDRENLNEEKLKLLTYTNRFNRNGKLKAALEGADVFIGVSKGNLLTGDDIKLMHKEPIILAMANPIPEIMPDEALAAGASVVGTGRSDFPNQVNNVLAFPGIFRGALDARATRISEGMKIAAAYALANAVNNISADHVLPDPLNRNVAQKVAEAVKQKAIEEKLQRPL
ncbi:NADP-dependent malic enzyme [Kangiella sp. TOML190]|uniref:NAD(P)-dependent malic enzyme n=1 Tax=Kangiella sp. TOML190 TaxID=2931351 RepID=UPI00203AA7C9|nr:NADP-dependent malic enzyme [Kangiella sp. TOML190]